MHRRFVRFGLLPLLGSALATTAFAKEHFRAVIDQSQEVPPTGSPATGSGWFVIDPNTNTLFYHVSYSGLTSSEIAAHIHGYSGPGVNSGVKHLFPTTNPKVGAWAYPAADEAQIMSGLSYVNIHTTTNGGGEIRGQIVFEPSVELVAVIDGSQEVPPNVTNGLGVASFDIDTAANLLSYDIRYGLLTGTENAAHIHQGNLGVNGGVVHALPATNPKVGSWNYTDLQEPTILASGMYVNIHTSFDGAGEIRGQIEPISGTVGVGLSLPTKGDLSVLPAPNPLPHDALALFYRAPEGEKVTVEIVDVAGRVIRSIGSANSTQTGVFAWDTRDDAGNRVSGGVYFARIKAGAKESSARFVVLR